LTSHCLKHGPPVQHKHTIQEFHKFESLHSTAGLYKRFRLAKLLAIGNSLLLSCCSAIPFQSPFTISCNADATSVHSCKFDLRQEFARFGSNFVETQGLR